MLGDLKRNIYKYLLNRGLLRTKIVVLMDGGICSQMHQYLLGNLYRKRGFSVCYDLTFYKEWGLDINNEFVRNFDILKAFPYLEYMAWFNYVEKTVTTHFHVIHVPIDDYIDRKSVV